MITKFKLYNESLKDKLKGKTKEEIKNIKLKKLSDIEKEIQDLKNYLQLSFGSTTNIPISYSDELEKLYDKKLNLFYELYPEKYEELTNTNESLKDKLKGKSDDEINLIVKNKLNINDDIISVKIRKPITDYVKHRFYKGLDIYNLEYVDYDGEYVIVKGKPYNVMDFIKNYIGFRDETRLINYIKKFNI